MHCVHLLQIFEYNGSAIGELRLIPERPCRPCPSHHPLTMP